MNTVSEKIIAIDAHTIHTLQSGNPGRQSIMLLHGMKFQASTWNELGTLKKLAENDYHAVAIDLPGFGKSPAADISPAEVIKGMIAKGNLGKPVLIGPSMGGRVSLEFAIDNPDLVGGLVLLGPVGVRENQKKLSTIKAPTLIVWGSEDTISPPANGTLLEKEISDSRLVVFKGAPHPCYLDQPGDWHGEMLYFLKDKFAQ